MRLKSFISRLERAEKQAKELGNENPRILFLTGKEWNSHSQEELYKKYNVSEEGEVIIIIDDLLESAKMLEIQQNQ
jgi:adenine/guanine phosphoribosyltransferase-like PRPP-binding protein